MEGTLVVAVSGVHIPADRPMPTQAELNLLLNNPESFLKQHAIRWAGKGPDTQQNITAAIIQIRMVVRLD
jgi:hypothetical protein